MDYTQAIPILPSEDLQATERFFELLGFSRVSPAETDLRIAAGAVELRYSHLPGHARIEGTGFTNRTTVLHIREARDVRRSFKACGIAWNGWTPPHLGALEVRVNRPSFAFSDPDGNLFWVEDPG